MTAHSSEAGRPSSGSGSGDKRERILDAAERVFARAGFFAARVSEIAKEAGVADGTIYLYFKSKDDLLISLFESRMEHVNQMLADAISRETSPRAKLLTFVYEYLDLVRRQPSVAEVLTIELRQSSKFMKSFSNPRFADFLRLLGSVIAEGQAAGELDSTIPAPVAARMIFGILDELALAWLLASDKAPDASDVASLSTKGKKFDIVRAAGWVGAFITQGLERRSNV
jgi:TetR/AcrR family fatty acid metabolism transcriptional regulator